MLFFPCCQITNQLVLACRDYIKDITISPDDDDKLWDCVTDEVLTRDVTPGNSDPQQRILQADLESKLKVCCAFLRGKISKFFFFLICGTLKKKFCIILYIFDV